MGGREGREGVRKEGKREGKKREGRYKGRREERNSLNHSGLSMSYNAPLAAQISVVNRTKFPTCLPLPEVYCPQRNAHRGGQCPYSG